MVDLARHRDECRPCPIVWRCAWSGVHLGESYSRLTRVPFKMRTPLAHPSASAARYCMSGSNGVTPDLALGAETWLAADIFCDRWRSCHSDGGLSNGGHQSRVRQACFSLLKLVRSARLKQHYLTTVRELDWSRILRRQQQWRSKQFQCSTRLGWRGWGTRGCYLADNVNTHLLRLLGTQTIL